MQSFKSASIIPIRPCKPAALSVSEIGTWEFDVRPSWSTLTRSCRCFSAFQRGDGASGIPLCRFRSALHPSDRLRNEEVMKRTLREGGVFVFGASHQSRACRRALDFGSRLLRKRCEHRLSHLRSRHWNRRDAEQKGWLRCRECILCRTNETMMISQRSTARLTRVSRRMARSAKWGSEGPSFAYPYHRTAPSRTRAAHRCRTCRKKLTRITNPH